jgi:hypothetical protein
LHNLWKDAGPALQAHFRALRRRIPATKSAYEN